MTIKYNKLHADPKQGKTLDLVMKKLKHAMVENMSSSTADALGLSRAILCNDSLVKKLEELERTEMMYKGMVEHTKRVRKGREMGAYNGYRYGSCVCVTQCLLLRRVMHKVHTTVRVSEDVTQL